MVSTQYQKEIHLLPEHLIDQIKAGEVVERPASIIKELLENSIDAECTRIEITIVENGLELIRIKDDGIGIESEQLPMAFCRHATSKISSFEDLYRLMSYGFRGEALASVAAVSRIECESTPRNNTNSGGRLLLEAGMQTEHLPLKGRESGTVITVRDLFYNTPARLKFVKSQSSEKNALSRMIDSFLLSHPQITFSIQWDQEDRKLYKAVPPEQNNVRIWDVIGKKGHKENEIIAFEKEHLGHRVSGFVSLYTVKSQAAKSQFMFANGRIFQDKSFHHSISQAMEQIWNRENGAYVLFIQSPTDEIDVNVHPNKTQVKFAQSSLIYSLIIAAIKEVLPEREQSIQDRMMKFSFENQHSSSYSPSRSFDLPSLHSSTDHSHQRTFHLLGRDYALLSTKEGHPYLFKYESAFFNWLETEIFTQKHISDVDTLPLLIAQPIEFKSNHNISIQELANMGLTLEAITPEKYLVKSIPEKLSFLKNISLLAIPIFRHFDKKNDQTLIEHFPLSKDEIFGFFDFLLASSSTKTPFAKPITLELMRDLLP
ncbi:MAG: hypothetical protein COW00_08955 [Bdellovibrio sp. CG12_big_fil_rev_8_21_14_0_65_39_13]|nr:MAG: hypothetical protein COW78_09025 [Bdellovibrio sp. CG22_combo_CG10-13_8_21_14_all_39_27]PIQ59753.1 MAG: hypothetical protein COW00_08955 [Bdellovibrio sp. CG12_big_fil_rev_8_21_14_0_65_39_13]PIR36217.1 MAG: hypothetical protein COV37_04430 [Bdellovibrio sp. CG11_big_fil_rev_8_21_14_0_20_39_38]PJB53876.1 MAG: hypothetical protein CO099_04750 [Bdellovibrio sp. CG_4_9_14_3_um_filter_39_7]